eukprot:2610771-Prymnesium_polylepis.1
MPARHTSSERRSERGECADAACLLRVKEGLRTLEDLLDTAIPRVAPLQLGPHLGEQRARRHQFVQVAPHLQPFTRSQA